MIGGSLFLFVLLRPLEKRGPDNGSEVLEVKDKK